MSYKYLAEAIFFLGVAIGLVKWIGHTLVETAGPKASRESEEMFLARMMSEHLAKNGGAGAGGDAGIGAGGGAGNVAAGPEGARKPVARATTGAITAHCPGCGAVLNTVPNLLPFAADCRGCGRRVNVRGDGPGRISVVAIEPNG